MSTRIITGDCVEAMAAIPEASVDAIVCDPPYHLSFMGKAWDHAPTGTESQAAGFTAQDSRKSLDVSKAIDKRPGVSRHAEFRHPSTLIARGCAGKHEQD